MAPVVRALHASTVLCPVVVVTGQHRELLDDALSSLELSADVNMAVMAEGQTPTDVAARVLARLPSILVDKKLGALLVQGDTTTAMSAAIAAYYAKVPVGHVEAGLRTYDHEHPFPEEANRQIIARLARWSFAPTTLSADNLKSERVPADRTFVVGNTAVDSILWMAHRAPPATEPPGYVLVTLHRRESFGEPLESIARGLVDFLDAEPAARAVWPLHPNPSVKASIEPVVSGHPRIHLIGAQAYAPFVGLLRDSRLVLTDSGGIQEEAPCLGKTVLIARETTERPEALSTGQNRLVGRSRERVGAELARAWSEPVYSGAIPAPNPFGDGDSAQKIVEILERG